MYKIIEFPSDGLMLTMHPRWGRQLWALARLTVKRMNDNCAICELPLQRVSFRPMTNKGNRYKRICRRRHLIPRAPDLGQAVANPVDETVAPSG